jgi:transcriptional regulator with XRE-family HTH domain
MSRPKLRVLREQQKLTLKQMAAKIGCSESFLSRFENGIAGKSIEPAMADKIGAAYKCRIRLVAGRVVR